VIEASKRHLVFVSNNPFPYHTPILNELSRLVRLHVLYMSRDHPMGSFRDPWGEPPTFEHSFHWARSLAVPMRDLRVQASFGVSRALRRLSPDAILFSSWGPLVLEPLAWKAATRRKAVMWGESTAWSGLHRGRIPQAARRSIVRLCDAFVTDGSHAAEYLASLGADRDRIVRSCLPSIPRLPPSVNGSTEGVRFLFVGRFIPRKRPVELVRAFAGISGRHPKATLAMVGDGPLAPEVEMAAQAAPGRVLIWGRLEGAELGDQYARSDVLVVPSRREVWGLVVNEALAAGLYIIATDEVGSAHDLVDVNSGEIIPGSANGAALAAAMERAIAKWDGSPAALARRRARVADCTPAAFARDIHRAVSIALGDSGKVTLPA
jgi:glycosyltransferase involved in cell wall biosynthesis